MFLCLAGVSRVCVVMIMGRWSEERVSATFQDVKGARFGVQKVMSGDVTWRCGW